MRKDKEEEFMAEELFPGCPPFRIRRGRGRHVRLVISAGLGLEVRLPRDFDLALLGQAIGSRREWIRRQWERLCAETPEDAEEAGGRGRREWGRAEWPACMDLPATGEHFGIRYEKDAAAASVRENWGILMVRCPDGGWERARRQIGDFLKRRAKKHFASRLASLAVEKGLPAPARVRVGEQRSRWGSRSATGTISLNAALLFLPPGEAEYVLLHELCHGLYMDHSERYWQRLGEACPEARELDRRLAQGWRHVPRWFLPF